MISTTVRPDALVVGVEHRDQPRVGGALHVVLAAQGMQAGARLSDLPGRERERDEAPGVVGAVHVLRDAHAPHDDRGFRGRVEARDFPDRLCVDAADGRHRLGRKLLHVLAKSLVPRSAVADEGFVDQALFDDRVQHRVQQRDVGVGLELQVVGRVARELAAPGIGDDELHAGLRRVLHPGRRDRMVHRRVGADEEDHFGFHHVAHLVRYRAGVDALHERGDRRCVAETRAVVDIVRSEAGAHQLLEQIGLLVRALRRTEAGERFFPIPVADVAQACRREIQRLFPARLAEHTGPVVRIDGEVLVLLHAGPADEGLGQTVLVLHVVEAVAPLHAQAVAVGGTFAALHPEDLVALDVVGEQAPDAAIGADRVHRLVRLDLADFARGHQSARRAGLHAFAAGDAGGIAHGIVEIEHDLRMLAAVGVADDVVHLFLAAGAQAAGALDAGIQVYRDRGVGEIGFRLVPRLEARLADFQLLRPAIKLGIERVGFFRNVREQKLEHHLLARHRARAVGGDLHAVLGVAAAGRREHALALDFDHAGAAVAVRAHAFLVTEVRDVDAVMLGRLDEGLVRPADDGLAVQLELDRHRRRLRGAYAIHRSSLRKTGDRPPFSSSFMSPCS